MRSDEEVKKILEAEIERRRVDRIAETIKKRDAHVVVEKKPEPPIEWMIGTND
jgi:hypothetical protein